MEVRKFKLINNILGWGVFLISAFVYLSTIEPTTSFWDCGEFIASSYKLEVGHPPGNPVFQIIARFFTLFGSNMDAAMLINSMSAIFSAFTILFLFWTITHLSRRIIEKRVQEKEYVNQGRYISIASSIAVYGSGLLGSLAYSFSDTFWFSAVEAEVYAMSSFFTAIVFWAMLKWEEEAEDNYSNRWIILIAFLMGLSIGVHLLNLLTIPALVFIYYYKKYKVSNKGILYVLIISAFILGTILYGVIPYLPKTAALFDLMFVNLFGLPFNSGALFFMVLLLAGLFYAIFSTYKRGKVLANTILLSFTMIVIGYSTFAVVIIRSEANTPTNENQPDNPFSLVRYLGREQYGSNPLIFGETYASPYEIDKESYYTKVGDKYKKVDGPLKPVYSNDVKMLFPRMWSNSPDHVKFYESYTNGRGKSVLGSEKKLPLFKDNLAYFFDYQVSWMYFRYFMWNFAGRQNDIQGTIPGDPLKGNWESGIKFIDKARLGDQSEGPDYLINSKAKNHYYLLPLILGFIGLFYQLGRDKQNWWITFLLFILTGIAIVVYLNQYPFQARERDYAYSGSFYVFAIWIGMAVLAFQEFLDKKFTSKLKIAGISLVLLLVPVLMLSENWNDHDRSNRYSARDLAYNYLMTTEQNSVLVTHGDNDTFPLWYIQEVEGVRTDVRVVNTSLLGIDWYINQMKFRTYESDPLKLTIPQEDYLYGTNDYLQIEEKFNRVVPLKGVVDLISNPDAKFRDSEGNLHSFFSARKVFINVNKENALKSGIISQADVDSALDTIVLNIPEGKQVLSKTEMAILDLLANYNWERPIYFSQMGGDLEIGIKDYLEFNGFSYKFVPFKSTTKMGSPGRLNSNKLYELLTKTYKYGNLNDPKVNIDYQNLFTFGALMPIRSLHSLTAKQLFSEGKIKEAVEVLDNMQKVMPASQFPLSCTVMGSLNEYSVLDAIEIYLKSGEKSKGIELANAFVEENFKGVKLFSKKFGNSYISQQDLETSISLVYYTTEILKKSGESELSSQIMKKLEDVASAIK